MDMGDLSTNERVRMFVAINKATCSAVVLRGPTNNKRPFPFPVISCNAANHKDFSLKAILRFGGLCTAEVRLD